MLLTVDVGNTNITFGILKKDNIIGTFRITTKNTSTSDEYAFLIKGLIKEQNIKIEDIEDVIISSVVPNIMHALTNCFLKIFNKTPYIVGPGTKTGIRVKTGNAGEIGADRIVDVAGAMELYKTPAIVIDFGTATTYDLVDKDGTFITGITAPGIRICAKALWQDTAKLPEIEIALPKSVMAANTIESMQAGLVYGHIGEAEYIIDRLKKESGIENLTVIATGGLGKIISKATKKIDIYDPNLTLIGLNAIYKKTKNRH